MFSFQVPPAPSFSRNMVFQITNKLLLSSELAIALENILVHHFISTAKPSWSKSWVRLLGTPSITRNLHLWFGDPWAGEMSSVSSQYIKPAFFLPALFLGPASAAQEVKALAEDSSRCSSQDNFLTRRLGHSPPGWWTTSVPCSLADGFNHEQRCEIA